MPPVKNQYHHCQWSRGVDDVRSRHRDPGSGRCRLAIGCWKSTAIYLTGKRAPEGSKWVFGADGSLARTSLYKSLAESEGTIEEKFEVKDGKIVTPNGDTFALIEKKPDTMTLKGPFGYYFLKKDEEE